MKIAFSPLVILLPLIAGTASAVGKGPCNGIKQHKDKLRGLTSYISPAAPVIASKWQRKKDTSMYLNFSIDGGSELVNEQDPDLVVSPIKGLLVHFTDGTTWTSDTATIRHYLRDGTSVFSYSLKLDDKTLEIFTIKKIEKFILAGLTQKDIKIAALIPQYLSCLKTR